MAEVFQGSFTQQEPIPEDAIEAAVRVMRHGRLHRYNTRPDETAETALLETEFAAQTGAPYALAVASGGYALGCALRALGVGPGDSVLTNGFTLAPVPGAIAALGARPVFVETTERLVIDPQDLRRKIESSRARVLLLSHMRGHLCDMDALIALCDAARVRVVEDCAHTMGASWRGTPSGRHGVFGCFSTQTYKHVNSGEGGLLIGSDPQLMARAVLLSGSYMLYERHLAAPPPEAFEDLRLQVPNVSGRMDNLRAAILRPQLRALPQNIARWTLLHEIVQSALAQVEGLALIHPLEGAAPVRSSFQFRLPDHAPAQIRDLLGRCAARGVELKWFGEDRPTGFTSRHDSWRYAAPQALPRTDRILAGLIDMRLPLSFTGDDAALIARIIAQEVRGVR